MTSPRIHGRDAAGGGDAGELEKTTPVGACPGCGAELAETEMIYPPTGQTVRALCHPMPFCTYFGRTSPEVIEAALEHAKARS